MKYLAALLLCAAISGCLSSPGKVGDPPSTVAGAASFYKALADYAESDECETSDEFLSTAAKAARLRKVPLGEAWDTAFAEMAKSNSDLTPELRSEIARKVRGMK